MMTPIVGSHIEAYPYDEIKLNIFNKNTKKTFILGEKESQVFIRLNGVNTIEDIQRECSFYSLDQIKSLIYEFSKIGLFSTKKTKFNPFKIKFSLLNPNKFFSQNGIITMFLHYFTLIGCPLIFILGTCVFRYMFASPSDYLATLFFKIETLNFLDVACIIVLSLISLMLHEFAHTITARRYGVNVPEIGLMLYCFLPCAYTNISGINLLKSKGKRIVVLISGSLINLAIIGMCCIIMSILPTGNHEICAFVLLLVNLGTIFMNTMIFLKFDGYYIIETLLEEPNMREKSFIHIVSYINIVFGKDKTAKGLFADQMQTDNDAFLLHVVYILYTVLSVSFIPFVIINTVTSFFT